MRYILPKGLFAAQGRVVVLGGDKIVVQEIGSAGGGDVEKSFQFVSLVNTIDYIGTFSQEIGDEVVNIEYVSLPEKHYLVTVKKDIDFINDKYLVLANTDTQLITGTSSSTYANISFENVNANQFKVYIVAHSDKDNNHYLSQRYFSLKIYKMEEV